MGKLVLMLVLLACCVMTHGQQQPGKAMPFTTDTPMVHDPVMAYEDSIYHIFATGMGIQQMTSKDRKHWTEVREPVRTGIAAWRGDYVPAFRDHVRAS